MTGYRPISIVASKKIKRKPIKPARPPLPPAFLNMRKEISEVFVKDLAEIREAIKPTTPEQKRAIFLKIEHERPVDFTGTDLKKIFESGDNFSIVKVTDPSLKKLQKKAKEFGTGPLSKGHAKNETLFYNIQSIESVVDPYAKVSSELFKKIAPLTDEDVLVYEVEISSDLNGVKQQKNELKNFKEQISKTIGVNSRILEHEDYYNSSRLLIRSSKQVLTSLIEDKPLFGAIKWFDDTLKTQKPIINEIRDFNIEKIASINSPAKSSSTICVIDSGVTKDNPFIKPLIQDDDNIRSYISTNSNPYDEADHGTGVASLSAYYSLNISKGAENKPVCWIASAKVLNANNELEEEKLFSKTLREIVKDFKAKGIRVFNLSICFRDREWNDTKRKTIKKTSWIARAIDNISHDEDVLFIIPTGNINHATLNHVINSATDYPSYYTNEEFTLLDPSHATYALTVGSIATSTTITTGSNVQAISQNKQPSPFTRRGPGILGEVKPELVDAGGNLGFDSSLKRVRTDPALNVYVAKNSISPAVTHSQGTSLSSPRVAYKAASLLSQLSSFGLTKPSMNLVKTFLINSAESISIDKETMTELSDEGIAQEFLTGYGIANENQATYCDKERVLLFHEGTIPIDRIVLISIPIPTELAKVRGKKKLVITTCSSPEIQKSGLKKYHGSRLKWSLFKGNVSEESIVQLLSLEESEEDETLALETEEQEVGEVKSFKYGTRLRSKGCVQHDEYEWTVHKEDYSLNDYTLAITCRDIWKTKQKDVPFSLVVRLEVENKTAVSIDIYNLIRTKIETRIKT